eukprot:scaffold650512_cov50-Prasinocladus_malaysianus.AAC.1
MKQGKKNADKGESGTGSSQGKHGKAELEMLLMRDSDLLDATRGVLPAVDANGAEDGQKSNRKRMSRKERLRAKKEARAKARQDDSDDDEL